MSISTTRTPEDCFDAAVRRFEADPEVWKSFNGTMEFVLTNEGGDPEVSYLEIEPGEMRRGSGRSPVTPIGRVTMSAWRMAISVLTVGSVPGGLVDGMQSARPTGFVEEVEQIVGCGA